MFVDYAHTEKALESALAALGELRPSRLLLVFGCGGERDRDKRPKMGRVAERLATLVFLTNDNPRREDPARILGEIRTGLSREPAGILPDRREAIGAALSAAQPGDIVLIAGKGHEAYQILEDTVVPFDDRQVAREILQQELSRPVT